METPFVFGKIVYDKDFTDREQESEKLLSCFISSVNTILISPRRWGKSSLVLKVSELVKKKDKNIHICFIDLNNVRTEEQFYKQFTTEVLKVMSTKTQVLLDNAKKFLGRFVPVISLNPLPGSEFKLSLDWEEVKREPDDILDLPEKICKSANKKLVICIDEFQNISELGDPLGFQKKLRSHWQKHRKVSYCLYGSKKRMMTDVFTSPSMPFFRFGEVIFLDKISTSDWVKFIVKRFRDTGKKITKKEALMISDLADCHPYFVQQLAQQSWLRTEKACNPDIIRASFGDIVLQLSLLYQNLTDNFSTTQLNLLKALLNDEEQLSSQKIIQEYGLGTSANVTKIKKTLSDKEIIDLQNDKISFLDPLYKYWLKEYFFKIDQ
ncbi:MAG TPA: ATPase [Bacteroidales bacterium]|nr:ATPase [Bacteroidales bacterium]